MQHSIEELIIRINVMQNQAIAIQKLQHKFSTDTDKEHNNLMCSNLLSDLQGIALLIANDKGSKDVITEVESIENKG